ncbi:MAG: hypothetical protein J1F41_11785, partial [Lachnospiraceae bacterium]|nr:hypothetical protein [Lachnospiraceae bacterium]
MIEQVITSSILIVAILLISFLMEKKINPCLKYAVWLLVAIKLLIPLPEFQSTISVMNVANQIDEKGVRYLFVDNEIEEISQTPGKTPTYSQIENRENTGNRIQQKLEITDVCYFVWIAGMLICAGIFVWSNLRFLRKIRNSRVSIGRYKNKLNVYAAAGITSPCLFGLSNPAIYLQENRELSQEQREYVLAHEYIHYKHGDHVWAVVRCICVILYWYNPFVWLAARVSIKDSELACDWGALKLVGRENYKEYGKTLIEVAKGIPGKSPKYHVLGCPTSAAGGGKELKKRMQLIAKQPRTKLISLLILLVVCISIVSCTFGSAVDYTDTKDEPISNNDTAVPDDTALIDTTDKKQLPIDEVQDTDNITYKAGILYQQAEADKVCIRVEPSVLRDQLFYYYIPADEDQEWLIDRVKSLDLNGEPFDRRWEGKKETGWRIYYNDIEFMVFEGGYLYYTYDGEDGAMECLIEDPKLCDYIQIMLQEELDYYQFDVTKIDNIISARLDVCSYSTNYEVYSQTITDKETLKKFAGWFSNADYIYGGVDCANEC